jgi:archaellin
VAFEAHNESKGKAGLKMLRRLLSGINRGNRGVTGLETAIILIACVTVVAVFTFSLLSAGVFSTQQSETVSSSALDSIGSSLVFRGDVLGYRGDASINNTIGRIEFAVTGILQSGQYIDLTPPYRLNEATGALETSGLNNVTTIEYIDENVTAAQLPWTISWAHTHSSNYFLAAQEAAVINVWLHSYNGTAWAADSNPPFLGTSNLGTRRQFTMVIRTSKGAGLVLKRNTPLFLDPVTDLH